MKKAILVLAGIFYLNIANSQVTFPGIVAYYNMKFSIESTNLKDFLKMYLG